MCNKEVADIRTGKAKTLGEEAGQCVKEGMTLGVGFFQSRFNGSASSRRKSRDTFGFVLEKERSQRVSLDR